MAIHFKPYGDYVTACGLNTSDEESWLYSELHRGTTCVSCLQLIIDRTEERVISEVEKLLERSTGIPAGKGWNEQVAKALIKSFEIGERYGKLAGWDELCTEMSKDCSGAWIYRNELAKSYRTKNPYRNVEEETNADD